MREAVLAWKISDKLTKEQILEYYLNSVPFGRNTYGVEAAAQAFFGKTVKKNAKPERADHPGRGDAAGARWSSSPSPTRTTRRVTRATTRRYSPEAEHAARLRWDYVHGRSSSTWASLTQSRPTSIEFPLADVKPVRPEGRQRPGRSPAGLVINHVLERAGQLTRTVQGQELGVHRDGGYKIYTTLDYRAQTAAEAAADETLKGSQMYGQPDHVAGGPGRGRAGHRAGARLLRRP